jgi:hypothetical protein
MKTIKLYETADLQKFHKNTPFRANRYREFSLTPKLTINDFDGDKMDDSASAQVIFVDRLKRATDADLVDLKQSYNDSISQKASEIIELQNKITEAEKAIRHYKKQQSRIKDSKSFIEAFEILIQ